MTAQKHAASNTLYTLISISLLALLMSFGCQISPRRTVSPTPTPTPGVGGQLYVTSGNAILRFNNAETSNGAFAPAATISGPATGLSRPQRVLVDSQNNRLYVANRSGSSILVFDNVSTLSGSIAPTRVVSGAATGLAAPVDMALDTGGDKLYVADETRILVFANASTAGGNPAPVRTINMGVTVGAIRLDTVNNILYVADPADNIIDVLGSASQQNVIPAPTGIIVGADTQLSGPSGLELDASGRLLVSNSVAPVSLTFYPNATTANGDVLPVAAISGNRTRLSSPTQLLLNRNVSNGELYVVDSPSGSILVFTGINSVSANVAPTRVITSPAIAANSIGGIALDSTR